MALILVVDDDQLFRTMLSETLVNLGHNVVQACNGTEGLKLYRRAGADLIITDIVMPEAEGFELLTELQKNRSRVKIIAMSGGGRGHKVDYLESARCLGAARVLAKPFTNDELLAAIQELLPSGATATEPKRPS